MKNKIKHKIQHKGVRVTFYAQLNMFGGGTASGMYRHFQNGHGRIMLAVDEECYARETFLHELAHRKLHLAHMEWLNNKSFSLAKREIFKKKLSKQYIARGYERAEVVPEAFCDFFAFRYESKFSFKKMVSLLRLRFKYPKVYSKFIELSTSLKPTKGEQILLDKVIRMNNRLIKK
jgi:hypothetical protein